MKTLLRTLTLSIALLAAGCVVVPVGLALARYYHHCGLLPLPLSPPRGPARLSLRMQRKQAMNQETDSRPLYCSRRLAAPALSQAGVDLDINVGPAAAVVEPRRRAAGRLRLGARLLPLGRRRHVWVPGHYWNARGLSLDSDHWDRARTITTTVEGHWAR